MYFAVVFINGFTVKLTKLHAMTVSVILFANSVLLTDPDPDWLNISHIVDLAECEN